MGMEGASSDLGTTLAQVDPSSENSGHRYIWLFVWFPRARRVLYLDLDV